MYLSLPTLLYIFIHISLCSAPHSLLLEDDARISQRLEADAERLRQQRWSRPRRPISSTTESEDRYARLSETSSFNVVDADVGSRCHLYSGNSTHRPGAPPSKLRNWLHLLHGADGNSHDRWPPIDLEHLAFGLRSFNLVAYRAMLFHDKKLLVCISPKAASTTTKAELLPHYFRPGVHNVSDNQLNVLWGPFRQPKAVNRFFESNNRPMPLASLKGRSNELVDEVLRTYTKVIVVRNPLDRFLSFYNNKIRMGRADMWRRMLNVTKEASALDVIEAVKAASFPRGWEQHFLPQTFLCRADQIKYDFVVHVENYVAEANEVFGRFGYKFENIHFGPIHSAETHALEEDVDRRVVEMVTAQYEADARAFGYCH